MSNLSNVYDDITVDAEPSIVALRTVAHLGTRLSARWSGDEPAPDALDVLRMLHPTAAVGGMPRESAYELLAVWKSTIEATSPDRLDGLTQQATASGGLDCAACSCAARVRSLGRSGDRQRI